VSLGDFFGRPIKIAEYEWTNTDVSPFFETFDPWFLYIINSRVANRISNYFNMSGNMHVKIVVNGNSFLYGRLMADYFPLRDFDNVSSTASSVNNLVQASQRMHIYLDPCVSQGGEMTLPFIWPLDKVNLPTDQFSSLGQMYIREMQPLQHANAATGSVNISVFAWMSNVKLSIPTVNNVAGITPQSGVLTTDEYGQGAVSGPAAAIASAAGKLAGVPYIGQYARATSMVAGVMAKVARIFGYSRPAIIADYTDMRPSFVGRMAVTDAGDNVAKLTVDSKQELTIDPQVVGVSAVDELAISNIVSRESYITNFPWVKTAAADSLLFTMRVGPVYRYTSPEWFLPAVTFASLPFKYWRGSMIYRFQIVASGYHKGRLLVVWDPYVQTSAPETNIQYSKIVDLADERDFTFEVGWGSPYAWLTVPNLTSTLPYSNTTPFAASTADHNGVISVYVLNELTTPSAAFATDIAINVFVSACDDYKLSVPSSQRLSNLSYAPQATPQSGTFEEVDTEMKNAPSIGMAKETIAMCEPLVDSTDLVYMGESIVSLRQLLKRYNFYTTLGANVASTVSGMYQYSLPAFPLHRGYSLYGPSAAPLGNINPGPLTLMNYLSSAFIAYRGGTRWKILVDDILKSATTISVDRVPTLGSYTGNPFTYTNDIVTTQYDFVKNINQQRVSALAGSHYTISEQPVLEFEVPFYQDRRFSSTRNLGAKGIFAADDLSFAIKARAVVGSRQTHSLFVAGAEDSTFVGFQGCAPLRVFALP